jgi:hypothetical protein
MGRVSGGVYPPDFFKYIWVLLVWLQLPVAWRVIVFLPVFFVIREEKVSTKELESIWYTKGNQSIFFYAPFVYSYPGYHHPCRIYRRSVHVAIG